MGMIYFDQAATSFQKPPQVLEAVQEAMLHASANPGRGGHMLARKASAIVADVREKAAKAFGCSDPRQALYFHNATAALNQAIKGIEWQAGDHVIATAMEHNSIRRPLEYLRKTKDIEVTYIDAMKEDVCGSVKKSISPQTKLIAMTHASNVTGDMVPIREIADIVKAQQIPVLIDASQTAGHIAIDMKTDGINMLVFPGHKGLMGPQGTGMLLVEGDIALKPILHGGTGAFSENVAQPEQWPERFESGTLNVPAIAGLGAAIDVYMSRKHGNVPRETILINQLIKRLEQINGIRCYGPGVGEDRLPIIAFNIEGANSQEIAMILDSSYNICVRAGLHCSPLIHDSLGTLDQGIVRASLSMYNTETEIDQFLHAMTEIAAAYRV